MSRKTPHNNFFSFKKNKSGAFAAAVFILGLAVLAGHYMEQNTRITNLGFSGNIYTDIDDLNQSFHAPVGELADSVDYATILHSVQKLPYVSHASIQMKKRGTLEVQIVEREPIALLIDGSEKAFVASDGVKLPITYKKTLNLPLLYGFPVHPMSDTLKSEPFKEVAEFLHAAKKQDVSWMTISEVTWNPNEGVVALSQENGVKLIFGHEEFENKLVKWTTFYTDVATVKSMNAFRQIDLRFKNQIVTQET